MDGQRFDAMTKALSTGTSRRRLLGGLVAGAVGAMAGALGPRRAGAQTCSAYGRVCAGTGCCTTPGAECHCYANGHCRCRCPEGSALVDGACVGQSCPGGVVCSEPRSCQTSGGTASTEGICCKHGEWAFACCRDARESPRTITGCCEPFSTDPSKKCPGFAGGPLCQMAAASTCGVP